MCHFEVWHVAPELLSEAYSHPERAIARWLNTQEHFIKVAEVAASDLGVAYALTQNKESSWSSRPEIIWSSSRELRSTSAGDVLVQNGHAWLVTAWEGFTEIKESNQ